MNRRDRRLARAIARKRQKVEAKKRLRTIPRTRVQKRRVPKKNVPKKAKKLALSKLSKEKTRKPGVRGNKKPKKTKIQKPVTTPSLAVAGLTQAQEEALRNFGPEDRKKILSTLAKSPTIRKAAAKEEKKLEARAQAKAVREAKKILTARKELEAGVRAANKNGGELFGYNPVTKEKHKVKGTFSGFKRVPFKERAAYIQADLKEKFTQWRRDLIIQSVHLREYLAQEDGGSGRRAIVEKVRNAGYNCIDKKLVTKTKDGMVKHTIYQIYIGTIRILIRQSDANKYGGYSTHPISTKKGKYATDIRGLEGFQNVTPGEDPKAALDRLLEKLDNHLDDILDGLPVVYVKSLQIKFDVEAMLEKEKK